MDRYQASLHAISQLLHAPRYGTGQVTVQRREVKAPHRRPKKSALDLLEYVTPVLDGDLSGANEGESMPMDTVLTIGVTDGYGRPGGSARGAPGNEHEALVMGWAIAAVAPNHGNVVLTQHEKKLLEKEAVVDTRVWDMRHRFGMDPTLLGVKRNFDVTKKVDLTPTVSAEGLELSRRRGMFESGVAKTLLNEALGRQHDRLVFRVSPSGLERIEEWEDGERWHIPTEQILAFYQGHLLTTQGPVKLDLLHTTDQESLGIFERLLASALLGVP